MRPLPAPRRPHRYRLHRNPSQSPSIEVDAVTPETEHAHALWLSSSSSSAESSKVESSRAESRVAESSGAESSGAASSVAAKRETSGGEASESIPQILENATATNTEASVSARRPGLPRPASQPNMPGGQLIAPPQRRSTQQGISAVPSISLSNSSLESIGEDDSCVHPSHQTAPVRLTERSTQQGCLAAFSLSPSSSPSESICEDDSCVHPSQQTSPVRLTERGTAVAAVQFLELLRALDPSTGNLTTAQLTKGVTPRAAPAKTEHLRSWTLERSTQQGYSAVLSLSLASSSLESIGEDDSCVRPSHQTAPVRQTERVRRSVRRNQFLESLHALDPSTGDLTASQLTTGVTPRAAPAKPEHLRSWTPARPEALPAPEAAPADSAGAPANPEAQRDRPRSMSAEQHSAHSTEMDQHSAHMTEMMLLHQMRQTNNVRQRSTSGELRGARYTPAWSPGAGIRAGRSRAKTLDCFEGM